jgi:hypothetical protein
MKEYQFLLLPPTIERRAPVAADTVFSHAGRSLRVVKAHGTDKAAPVIVEELASFGPTSLKGQLGLWSNDSVQRAMRAKK